MYRKIREFAKKNNLFATGHIVMGLSGGADSVCLFMVLKHFMEEFGFSFTAVHVHHGIRGAEADRDMEFCKKLCADNAIPLKIFCFDVLQYAKEHNITSEEAGRILRYQSFEKEAAEHENCTVAVAHHMNDQAETVLFNICRGSGIRGVRGMLPKRDYIIRPLLCCTREEIEHFLRENNQEYCTDSTNLENDYSRNKIRNTVLPFLCENINTRSVENIAMLANRAAETENYIEKIVNQKYELLAGAEAGGILLRGLDGEDEYIAGRLVRLTISKMTNSLKDITQLHIDKVLTLNTLQSGAKADIRQGLWAQKTTEGIMFFYKQEKSLETIEVVLPDENNPQTTAGNCIFILENCKINKKIRNEVYTKYFDYDRIINSLQIRTRRTGDVIAVDDSGHHKRLKQYFIDEKIPQPMRDEIPLLACKDHIVWVIGYRIGAEYKVTDTTERVLKVIYGGKNNGKS